MSLVQNTHWILHLRLYKEEQFTSRSILLLYIPTPQLRCNSLAGLFAGLLWWIVADIHVPEYYIEDVG